MGALVGLSEILYQRGKEAVPMLIAHSYIVAFLRVPKTVHLALLLLHLWTGPVREILHLAGDFLQ